MTYLILFQGCIYQFKSDSDNIFESREIPNFHQFSCDVLSVGTSDLLGLLPSDTKIRAENESFNYKEAKTITHVEKEDTTSKNNNPLITYQLVSTKTDVGCRQK